MLVENREDTSWRKAVVFNDEKSRPLTAECGFEEGDQNLVFVTLDVNP